MSKMDENILVVERENLFRDEELTFQGLLTNKEHIKAINKGFKYFFEARRGDAETNPEWKQPIPYAIIRRDDSIFTYKRLKAGGEARLHDKLSIGVGGHMNHLGDVGNWNENLFENFFREINEELNLDTPKFEYDIVGLINDDANEVGEVHIGILLLIDLPSNAFVEVREKDTLEGFWMTIEELMLDENFERLESWSQFAIEVIDLND